MFPIRLRWPAVSRLVEHWLTHILHQQTLPTPLSRTIEMELYVKAFISIK